MSDKELMDKYSSEYNDYLNSTGNHEDAIEGLRDMIMDRQADAKARNTTEAVAQVIRHLSKKNYSKAETYLREALDRKAHKRIMARQKQIAESMFVLDNK